MRTRWLTVLVVPLGLVALALAGPATAAPSPSPSPIEGSGSSWAEPVIDAWAQDTAPGLSVDYEADGSSAARQEFAAGEGDFAVTDLAFADPPSRPFALLPAVAGAVSFPYQITVGGRAVRSLRLSGPTLAKIFSGQISNWNDPAVTADNNGHQIAPNLPITPVVRSDGTATSYQLTGWFSTEFGRDWRSFSRDGATEYFPPPAAGTVIEPGSQQEVSYVTSSSDNGSIGYVENSYALAAGAPTVAVLNRGGYYVPPTAGNVGIALLKARPAAEQAADLNGVWGATDPRAYPLSYFSYGVIPTGADDRTMTTARRQALVDFFGYGVCRGQQVATSLGDAPLPLNLTRAATSALARLRAADPAVDLSALDLASCANPTIVHSPHGRVGDGLRGSVPQPPACAEAGAGPCKNGS